MSLIMTEMITIIQQTARYFVSHAAVCEFANSSMRWMIRDTELETGLQKLMAPLVEARAYPPNSIAIRIIIDPNYNAFVAGEKLFMCIPG